MNRRFTFIVGIGEDRDGKSIAYELPHLQREAYRLLAETFGGYTVTFGRGGWVDSAGKLITEASMTLVVCTDQKTSIAAATVARALAVIFNQSSVLLAEETLDSLEFVEQN